MGVFLVRDEVVWGPALGEVVEVRGERVVLVLYGSGRVVITNVATLVACQPVERRRSLLGVDGD